MKNKIQFIILLIIPIIIIIASYFIDSRGLLQGKFISPLGSLYALTLENDDINIKLSQKEKKFIDTVKNLTMFVDEKNDNGDLKNIFLKETFGSNKYQIIFAKNGKIINENNNKILLLENGEIIKLEN